jgi:hypothetical protein
MYFKLWKSKTDHRWCISLRDDTAKRLPALPTFATRQEALFAIRDIRAGVSDVEVIELQDGIWNRITLDPGIQPTKTSLYIAALLEIRDIIEFLALQQALKLKESTWDSGGQWTPGQTTVKFRLVGENSERAFEVPIEDVLNIGEPATWKKINQTVQDELTEMAAAERGGLPPAPPGPDAAGAFPPVKRSRE